MVDAQPVRFTTRITFTTTKQFNHLVCTKRERRGSARVVCAKLFGDGRLVTTGHSTLHRLRLVVYPPLSKFVWFFSSFPLCPVLLTESSCIVWPVTSVHRA